MHHVAPPRPAPIPKFARAGDLLGRPYAIGGRVVRGKQLGRTLGYPTANLRFPRTPALSGIYATWVHGVAERPWPSVSSFGTRPTVAGVEPLLEAHLFDFQCDLYGRHIAVEFSTGTTEGAASGQPWTRSTLQWGWPRKPLSHITRS